MSVTDADVGHFRSTGSQSLTVLIEHDVSLSLDELGKKARVRISKEIKKTC